MPVSDDTLYTTDVNDILPEELLINIFKYLPIISLQNCEEVCERWRKLATDLSVWRNVTIQYTGRASGNFEYQREDNDRSLDLIHNHAERVFKLKLLYVWDYSVITFIIESSTENVTSLDIIMCQVEDNFPELIAKLTNLRRLNLKSVRFRKSDHKITIQYDHFKLLKYLHLCEFGLSSVNCDSLIRCKYLSHILIERIRDLKLEYIIALIESKKTILQTFHFFGDNAVNNNCLQLLSQCKLLKDLAIIRCEPLTDEGLVKLKNLKRLVSLQLWNNTNFTEKCLSDTLGGENLHKLNRLSLSRIDNITPAVVDVISEYYKNLKFLALYQCPKIINTDYEKQLATKFNNIHIVLY